MTVVTRRDHVALAASRWTDKFRDKPKLQALLAAYIAEVQELEDSAESQRVMRRLDHAQGAQLDVYGRIVQLERLGLADEEYRLMLKVWFYVIRAQGVANDVIHVVMGALGRDFGFTYREYYPAAHIVDLVDALEVNPRTIARLIRRVRMGGVNTKMVWSPFPPEGVFTLASGDEPEESATQGFLSETHGDFSGSPNLLSNPGFELGDDGSWSNWSLSPVSPWLIAQDINARTGDWCAIKAPVEDSGLLSAPVPCQEGQLFRASAWAKYIGDTPPGVAIGMAFIDNSSNPVDTSSGVRVAAGVEYSQISHSAVAPPGAAEVLVLITITDSTTVDEQYVYVDDAELMVGEPSGGRLAHVMQA